MMYKRALALAFALLIVFSIVPTDTLTASAKTAPAAVTVNLDIKSTHTPLAANKYYQYSTLNASQKKAYNAILNGIRAIKNKIDISKYKISQQDGFLLIKKVLGDHPEYFYVAKQYNLTLSGGVVKDVILLYYDGKKTDTVDSNYNPIIKASRSEIAKKATALSNKVSTILRAIPKNASQVVKEKTIHDYLINNITYNKAAAQGSSKVSMHVFDVYGALIEGSVVCEGYAKSFAYLCHCVGIDATLVTGYSGGEDHMWNTVKIGNEWFMIDVTWDDDDADGFPLYRYFDISAKELSKTHQISMDLALPSCKSSRNPYKDFCIDYEKGKLSSNYKSVIDTAVKNKECYLPIYIGKNQNISAAALAKDFTNDNSPVQKYIKSKKYNISFKTWFTYGQYACLLINWHSFKTTVTKATTSKNGKMVKACSNCGTIESETAIPYAKTFSLSTTSYTYDGKVKTPSVTVKDAKGKTLKKNTDYTVTYASGRKNVGTYKVTVKMKGNYSGTKTLTFKINPPKTTVSKLTAGTKSIKVTLTKKSTQVTGYEIQYATNSKFTNAKSKTVSSYKTTTATLSGLTAKKTYYVRVRTYKTVGKTKYYSAWSTHKSMKTK